MKVNPNKSIMSCGTGTSFIINNEGNMYATGLNHLKQLGTENVQHKHGKRFLLYGVISKRRIYAFYPYLGYVVV